MQAIRISIHKQMVQLNIYISNIYGVVIQNEIYCKLIMINIYFRVCVECLIDKREREIDKI